MPLDRQIHRLKRIGKTLLTQPAINRSVRCSLSIRQVKALIQPATLNRIPVVGDVDIQLWNGQVVRFASDGADTIATRLYWQGVAAFEPETYKLFSRLLAASRCFVDIGANTGFYALVAGVTDPTTSRPRVRADAFHLQLSASQCRMCAGCAQCWVMSIRPSCSPIRAWFRRRRSRLIQRT